MLKDCEHFISLNQREQRNGFYSRTLSTYFGKLNLKIPRVGFSNSFRPAILTPRFLSYLFDNGYEIAQNEEEGQTTMEQLIEFVKQRDPARGSEIEKKLEKYIVFLKYREEVRGKIYTTNAVESINSGLEYMDNGAWRGYFAS